MIYFYLVPLIVSSIINIVFAYAAIKDGDKTWFKDWVILQFLACIPVINYGIMITGIQTLLENVDNI